LGARVGGFLLETAVQDCPFFHEVGLMVGADFAQTDGFFQELAGSWVVCFGGVIEDDK